MTDARTFTMALGGRWYRRYGAAPCPVCQPERRKGQDALTLAEGHAGLLAHCKKSGCGFRDILAAGGIAPGSYTPPDPVEAARREGGAERPWRATHYCRTRDALLRLCASLCGQIDPNVSATLEALPKFAREGEP